LIKGNDKYASKSIDIIQKDKSAISHRTLNQITENKKNEPAFTHLDKVFWPKEGYTKGDLIEYYRQMGSFILPYLKDRPESLRRYPNGIEQEGFFQKNVDGSLPEWIESIKIEHEGKSVNYMIIQDLSSLLFAINMGCIDLNPFNSRIMSLDYPDYMILDLDPVDISFSKVVEVALAAHEILDELDIPNYCKTSGSRGLHIYVPMGAKYTYKQTKEFALVLAQLVHERLPEITSLERSPSKRQKKVYPDFLQNNFGQTLAAPYCVRPKAGATVSTPLLWSEVKIGLDPHEFTIKTIFKRLKSMKNKDLFSPVLGKGINLKKVLQKLAD
jgi:bifunctional non-homologous end joining protein LigD